jgi:formate dehydrogenase gamma subunit
LKLQKEIIIDSDGEKKYLRMSLNERIQHFLLLLSFITLAVTGFALKFPEAMWVRWFRSLFGENAFELRGLIHRAASVVMVGVCLYHIGYVSFTQRGKKLFRDIRFRIKDIGDFRQAIGYFLGKVSKRPKFGRFSYIEKLEYWAVVWGTVIMGITGAFLWFENFFLPIISNTGMDVATAIHYYEAILATLSILVWHFYFVIYNPDVYPMNTAWITGYLSEEEMEKEHPLELEEIRRKEEQEEIPTEPLGEAEEGTKDLRDTAVLADMPEGATTYSKDSGQACLPGEASTTE